MRISLGLAAVVGFLTTGAANAQISSLKIGVLTDMSGVYADPTGPGSVFSARQAVQDFIAGRTGNNIEVIAGDHQNKPDIGSAIANRWIDVDKVDVIVDVPTSSVAFAVNDIVKAKNKVFLGSGVFGIVQGQNLAGLLVNVNDVHALGLKARR